MEYLGSAKARNGASPCNLAQWPPASASVTSAERKVWQATWPAGSTRVLELDSLFNLSYGEGKGVSGIPLLWQPDVSDSSLIVIRCFRS